MNLCNDSKCIEIMIYIFLSSPPVLHISARSSSSGRIPIISEADELPVPTLSPYVPVSMKPETPLDDQARIRLMEEDDYTFLIGVVDKFSPELQQAIVDNKVPPSWYEQMRERVGELRRGHLSHGDSDHSPGAIHWLKLDGKSDYVLGC